MTNRHVKRLRTIETLLELVDNEMASLPHSWKEQAANFLEELQLKLILS